MKAWIDRNWNLIFHKKKCVRITFHNFEYTHNDIILSSDGRFRYLGKNWFKML